MFRRLDAFRRSDHKFQVQKVKNALGRSDYMYSVSDSVLIIVVSIILDHVSVAQPRIILPVHVHVALVYYKNAMQRAACRKLICKAGGRNSQLTGGYNIIIII